MHILEMLITFLKNISHNIPKLEINGIKENKIKK